MNTLRQLIVSKKEARPRFIYEGKTRVQFLVLSLNEASKDQQPAVILYDKLFPTIIFVALIKTTGTVIIPHTEFIKNYSKTEPVAQENYMKFIKEADDARIKYEFNEASYYF